MRQRVLTLLLVALFAMGLAQLSARPAAAATQQCFPQTGQCIQGRFLDYWLAHGGLAINGYPLTGERMETLEDGKQYLVQWFERVRMEYHPESADPQFQVLLGQFGRILHPADPPVSPKPGLTFFSATGHNVAPDFLLYWQANGGLAQFGYPLSEEFQEQLEDGKTYTVQYFERARFERHPENAPPYNILLGQFGRRILAMKNQPPPSPVILQDNFSSPGSGWPTKQFPDGNSIGYANGGYQMSVAPANSGVSATHSALHNLGDVKVQVDVTKVSGPDENIIGIQGRFQDTDHYYLAAISSQGTWAVVLVNGNAAVALASSNGTPNPAIKTGSATNRLEVDFVGQTITFFVNGQKLAEVQDSHYASGAVWLDLESGNTGGVTVQWNNFLAQKP